MAKWAKAEKSAAFAQQTPQADRPLNILLVHCHYRLPGGEDAVFADEAAALRARGHKVVLYERSNEESTSSDASVLQKLLLPMRAIYSFKTKREVCRLIRQHNIDVVHVHNTLLVISPSVFVAARAEGVPVVQTLHNFRLFCPGGVLLREGQICEDCPGGSLLCAVKHRCYRGSLAQSVVCAAVYGFHRLLGTYRRVNLIALTQFDKQKLLQFNTRHPVFDPAKITVKPNMVQLSTAALPQPLPLGVAENGRKNQIVYAGRLEELKGLRSAIEAWKKLKNDPAAPKLIICGTGPLDAWAKQAAEGCAVEFLGQVPRLTLENLLATSRAALVPSLCYESFALVPAQAHTLGTPVLGADIGNVGAAVQQGIDGLHFAPGDADGICAAVRALPALEQAADPLAMRNAAWSAYNPTANCMQLESLYRKLIAENK